MVAFLRFAVQKGDGFGIFANPHQSVTQIRLAGELEEVEPDQAIAEQDGCRRGPRRRRARPLQTAADQSTTE